MCQSQNVKKKLLRIHLVLDHLSTDGETEAENPRDLLKASHAN